MCPTNFIFFLANLKIFPIIFPINNKVIPPVEVLTTCWQGILIHSKAYIPHHCGAIVPQYFIVPIFHMCPMENLLPYEWAKEDLF